MRETVLCACVTGGIPDPACELCGGTAEVCGSCGSLGRVGDSVCPAACDASLPYYESLPRDPETMRIARELTILLAANAGTQP